MSEKYTEMYVEEVQEIEIDQEFAAEQAKKKRRLEIWDKVTTGLFIALLASPVVILLHIFLLLTFLPPVGSSRWHDFFLHPGFRQAKRRN